MDAKKCDRCEKFYDFYEGTERAPKIKANAVQLIDCDLCGRTSTRGFLDLCLDCMAKLETFLYGGDENG